MRATFHKQLIGRASPPERLDPGTRGKVLRHWRATGSFSRPSGCTPSSHSPLSYARPSRGSSSLPSLSRRGRSAQGPGVLVPAACPHARCPAPSLPWDNRNGSRCACTERLPVGHSTSMLRSGGSRCLPCVPCRHSAAHGTGARMRHQQQCAAGPAPREPAASLNRLRRRPTDLLLLASASACSGTSSGQATATAAPPAFGTRLTVAASTLAHMRTPSVAGLPAFARGRRDRCDAHLMGCHV